MDNTDKYGADYYLSHCGPIPYDRNHPHWTRFFGQIADELIRTLRPRRVFDAGCAMGFLVEAFWDRGVEAWGRDLSEFATSQARADILPYCATGSLTQPISGRFDLITCIEVLEHMSAEEGEQAIANLAAATDHIVFSSSPDDFAESTHVNVKPAIYWMKAFAKHGFTPLIGTTLPSITPYALVFAQRGVMPDDDFLMACAEIVRGRMKMAADANAHSVLCARVAELEHGIGVREQKTRELSERLGQMDLAQAALQSVQDAAQVERQAIEDAAQAELRAVRDAAQTAFQVLQDAAQAELRYVRAAAQTALQSVQDASQDELGSIVSKLKAAEAQYDSIANSTSWRAMSVLHRVIGRLPRGLRRRPR
jgi:SAM-dependent methyltransferase/ElaB/YqjD/DUF883 family membrane-anchored ribosome-binding protein